MGLMEGLGLKPTKAMRDAAAARARAEAGADADAAAGTPAPAVGLGNSVKPGGALKPSGWMPDGEPKTQASGRPGAEADDAARAQARAMRSKIVARHKELEGVYRRISTAQTELEQAIAKAPASSKSTLQAQKKQWDAALDKAARGLDQARRDVEALDDPTATRAELVQVAARAGAKGSVDGLVEVDTAAGAKDQKFNQRSQSTVEASYRNGVARVEKNESSTKLGLDGVTTRKSAEVTQQWAGGATRVGEQSQLKVGPGGIAAESKRTQEIELGGRKASIEQTRSAEIGPDGVKLAETVTRTATDGSSRQVARDKSIDRGDGKFGASGSKQVVQTDADGNADTRKLGAQGGLLASDKGMGGYGSAEGKLSRTDKDGVSKGVVGGLHAHMSCTIGDPAGDPPRYPVTIEINLGAEVTVSAGKGKKDSTDRRSSEVTLGADCIVRETRNLDASQLARYVAAARAASTGGRVDATLTELRILQAGVTQGWPVAQAMWKGGGKPLSKERLAQLTNVGDATELVTSATVGGKASGNFKAVSAELSASLKEDKSVKATRNAGGGLDVEAGDSRENKVGAKLGGSMGVVGGSFGGSYTVASGYGIEIQVAPDVKPDDPLFAALVACKTAADYEAFIRRHQAKIKVRGKLVSKAEASTSDVALTVAGVTGSIGSGSGVAEQARYDADGKLIESTIVGQQRAGGAVSAGSFKFGDSAENTATARRDRSGQASLDLARRKNQSDAGKMLGAMAAKVGLGESDGKDKNKGLLQTLAGGEEPDTQVHDVHGIRLAHKDLVALAGMARRDDWAAPGGSNAVDAKAWRAAQAAINASGGDPSVVADELSRFVGGSKKDRLALLRQFLRPGGKVGIGMAYSFPDALASLQKDFDELVVKDCEQRVLALAARGQVDAAVQLGNDLLGRLNQLTMRIKNSSDFSDRAAQADMASKMGQRRTALAEALRQAQGRTSAADEKAARLDEYNRTVGNCQTARRNLDEVCAALRSKVPGSGRMLAREALAHIDTFNRMFDLRALLEREIGAAQALAEQHGFDRRRYEAYRADPKVIDAIKTAYGMRGPS